MIDGALAVVDNYRPHIAVDPEWPLVEHSGTYAKDPSMGLSTECTRHEETARFIRHFVRMISEEGSFVDSGDTKYAEVLSL